jgi:hypothetical protein
MMGVSDETPSGHAKGEPMTDDKVAAFAGTLAEFYDRHLVPMMFAP